MPGPKKLTEKLKVQNLPISELLVFLLFFLYITLQEDRIAFKTENCFSGTHTPVTIETSISGIFAGGEGNIFLNYLRRDSLQIRFASVSKNPFNAKIANILQMHLPSLF